MTRMVLAVHPISGARALDQGGEDAIAGLRTQLVGVHLAAQGWVAEGCDVREGYAQVSFLGAVLRMKLVR